MKYFKNRLFSILLACAMFITIFRPQPVSPPASSQQPHTVCPLSEIGKPDIGNH